MDAAVRETEEEAGISQNQLIVHDYQGELKYPYKGQMKRVVYFLAEVKDPSNTPVTISDEHVKFEWLNLADSIKILEPYKDMQNLMEEVDTFIAGLSK